MFTRITTSITTVVVMLMVCAAPVSAKGPDSALLSGPGFDEPVELLGVEWNETVELLMEQTGLWFGIGDLPAVVADPGTPTGIRYELTWVNSGPPALSEIQRTIVQYLYLQDDGRVIIQTPNQGSLSGWGQSVIGWFEAPGTFVGTLAALGVDLEQARAAAQAAPPASDPSDVGWLVAAGVVLVLAVGAGLWQVARTSSGLQRPAAI